MLRKLFTLIVCLVAAVATASAQTPPDNEIWYTTTDGKKAELVIGRDSFEENGWYFEIISHTYNNGLGIIHANKPIKAYGCEAYGEVDNGFRLTGNNIKTITFPKCTEYFYGLTFSSCKNLRTIKSRYSSSDGRYLIKNGRLLGFAPGGLTKYTIPNSVTSIGEYAFEDCSSLTSITIPNSVTSIGDCAFSGCSSLTSITIPNSVTSIGGGAFAYCSSLTSITIPNSITEIWSAFRGCSSLTSITIPNSVTSIGWYAFEGCSSLTSITIPNSVTSIGQRVFLGCSSLKSFNGKFASEDGRCLIKDSELIAFAPAGLTSYTIPNSVTSIGEYAFLACSSLTSITIPNSVTSIGEMAFRYCSSLTSITIPNSVTSIGSSAFEGCSSLTSITIGNSVTSIGLYAFSGCSSLKSIKVSNKYCYNAFKNWAGCDITFMISTLEEYEEAQKLGATKLAIDSNSKYASKDGLCLIDNGKLILFIGKDLAEYTIPESVTSFGEGAFKDCSNLKSVKVANKNCYDYFKNKVANIAFYGANASADGRCLIIDGKLERFSAKGITEYTIPESVTSIGYEAFKGCSSLTSITIPNSVTSIGNYAFYDCCSLKSITIPNSVTSIGGFAFADCSSLTSITIPNSVTSIERYAFSGCSSLTSITIPNSVTSIGDRAFRDCSSLTSITIPNSVTSIGEGAFAYCSSLTSITIPNSVTSIGHYAFKDCYNLTSITCLATTPPAIGNIRIGETTMIYVPKEAVKAYKQDPKWSIYEKQIKRIK